MNDKIAESINKAVEQTIHADLPCIICTKGTRTRGIHFVGDNKDFGTPENKQRIIVYGICPECSVIPDIKKQVTENIKLRIQSMALIDRSKANN